MADLTGQDACGHDDECWVLLVSTGRRAIRQFHPWWLDWANGTLKSLMYAGTLRRSTWQYGFLTTVASRRLRYDSCPLIIHDNF